EMHAAADLADEQIDEAVAVPIDGEHGRSRARDAGLLALRHFDALAFVDDDVALRRLFELSIAGDEDHVAALLAQPAADVDRLAELVLELDRAIELPFA